MKILSKEEYIKLSQQPLKVPIYVQVASDLVSPIRAYYALKKERVKGFLLESRENLQDVGRYSFVGFDPKISVEVKDKKTSIIRGGKEEKIDANFQGVIRKLLQENKTIQNPDLPPLAGGAVGFIGYDAVRLFEKIPNRHKDHSELPDLFFGFYETVLAFDHLHQQMTLIYIPEKKRDPHVQYEQGIAHLKKMLSKVLSYSQDVEIDFEQKQVAVADFKTDCSDEEFQKIVRKCKEYILKGDLFQAVPSRNFYKKTASDPLDVFRALRVTNPSPFMFYLDNEDYIITGSSPQRFASLKKDLIQTMPVGGAIPREFGAQDFLKEKALLSDEKEIAEHMMLVDLARNDTGAIAMPGTVEVHDQKLIQRLSHVMHMTSRVTGRICPQYDALDVLKAFLPAGTLSGAPKIRAMEITDELESSRRGVYGGSICYIDYLGQLDSCIATCMACIQGGIANVRVGAHVVHDSIAEKKSLETLNKARVVLEAIDRAEGGRIC